MIEIYNLSKAKEWDEIVKTFADYDVYYLSGYVRSFEIHGDGEPQLLYYEEYSNAQDYAKLRGIYVYMKRPTAMEGVYDSITPYGYGGFLLDGLDNSPNTALYASSNAERLQTMWTAYVDKMKEEGVVDNFVRYHPVLANAEAMKACSDVIELGKTVAMDLTDEEVIWRNIHSKNRNMIRKAEKSGVD